MLFDDSVKNIRMAKELGWTTVLVGLTARDTRIWIATWSSSGTVDEYYPAHVVQLDYESEWDAIPAALELLRSVEPEGGTNPVGVLEDVQFVLISRFRDIYSAYAAFGGGATDSEDWKLSPSSFYRTLLRLGAEDEVVEAAMQALAPFCSNGHLALHDFVAL